MTDVGVNSAAESSLVTLASGRKISLGASHKLLFESAAEAGTVALDKVETNISKQATKLKQFKELQDLVDGATGFAKTLARDGAFSDKLGSIYSSKKASLSSSDTTVSASDYLTATLSSTASTAALRVNIQSIAQKATVVAGRPQTITTNLGMANTGTETLSDNVTLKLQKADYSGFETVSLTTAMTLDDVVAAIEAVKSTTNLTASTVANGDGTFDLQITANGTRNTYINFGDADVSALAFTTAHTDADTTFATTDTAISTAGIMDNDVLQIGSTSITLNANDTIQQLVNKINAVTTTTGVEATLQKEGSVYRLVLSTSESGSSITFGGSTSANVLDNLGLADSVGTYTGEVIVNGVSYTTSDNSVDLGNGRTLAVKMADPTKTFTVDVVPDDTDIVTNMTNFIAAINLIVQKVQWQEGVTEIDGVTEEPLLEGSQPLQWIKNMVNQLTSQYVNHAAAGYRNITDFGISVMEDTSHNSLDYLSFDTQKFSELLASSTTRTNTVDFLTNQQSFKTGEDEANFTLFMGPRRRIAALGGNNVAVNLRYDSDAAKYYADLSVVDSNGAAVSGYETQTVEVDPNDNFIMGKYGTTFEGVTIKYSGTLTDIQSASESVTVQYEMGLMGSMYSQLMGLTNSDNSLPRGRLVQAAMDELSESTRLETEKERVTKHLEKTEERILEKLARLAVLEQQEHVTKMRMQAMMAYAKN